MGNFNNMLNTFMLCLLLLPRLYVNGIYYESSDLHPI